MNGEDRVAGLWVNGWFQGELEAGRSVKLGKLGVFSIGIQSEGVETEEEYNSSAIKGAKMRYRPGAELKKMLAGLDFSKKDNG